MKATEKKEFNQTFELTKEEFTDVFRKFLTNAGYVIPEKSTFKFVPKIHTTERTIEHFTVIVTSSSEGLTMPAAPATNGNTEKKADDPQCAAKPTA